MGLQVQEDKERRRVEVKEVMPCIRLQSGDVQVGDVLVGIGKDDITRWAFRRLGARFADARAPVGRPIRMRFLRRVLRPGCTPSAAARGEHEEESDSPMTPVTPSSFATPWGDWHEPGGWVMGPDPPAVSSSAVDHQVTWCCRKMLCITHEQKTMVLEQLVEGSELMPSYHPQRRRTSRRWTSRRALVLIRRPRPGRGPSRSRS
jgi:hypothetical protein